MPKVDEIDVAIIRRLQIDGRQPYANIAAELGLAPSTVQQRASRLIEKGLLRVTAVTDPAIFGAQVMAEIALKVEGVKLREAAAAIAKFDEVSYVVICAGAHDILLEIACESNEALLDFISEKLSLVEGVRSSETFVYLSIIKNSYQWGVP